MRLPRRRFPSRRANALLSLLPIMLPGLAGWQYSTGQTASSAPAGALKLEDGTPIKLRVQRTLSSADAQVNDTVDFDVLEEVKVGDLIVIPKGSMALGTVTEAQPKRRMGRGGKLNVNIDSVRLADGEKAALRGVKDVKGGGHTGAMTGAIVATSIVFFPAAPLFLFMHGKDITIPKGTEFDVYVNGDFTLDPAKFTTKPASGGATAQAATPVVQTVETSSVVVKSTPDGADVMVDGKYMGSTPSTLKLTPGDHTISVEKSGFKPWQRTVTLASGSEITLDATLEKAL
jgi:PEGA domain-containing protein